jgi:hypothetical protein
LEGPVTVPIIRALGIGVTSSSRQEGGGGDDQLSGFGIVTLASLYPVITVEMLGEPVFLDVQLDNRLSRCYSVQLEY